MSKERLHVYVSGRVQGVGFRSYTKKKAKKLGLTGWVKNLPDGRVEIIVEGNETKLEKFIEIIKKGSSLSEVDRINTSKKDYTGSFSDFRLVY